MEVIKVGFLLVGAGEYKGEGEGDGHRQDVPACFSFYTDASFANGMRSIQEVCLGENQVGVKGRSVQGLLLGQSCQRSAKHLKNRGKYPTNFTDNGLIWRIQLGTHLARRVAAPLTEKER